MEEVREKMYSAINIHGLSSMEALEASQELDKYISMAQSQKGCLTDGTVFASKQNHSS